jgi:malate dehydrogenase (oxaloacetate-decarboxylating)(NADP+)
MSKVKANPKRVIFAEGENEVVLRAAIQYREFGYGEPMLVGRTQRCSTRWPSWALPIRKATRSRTRWFPNTCRADGGDALRAPQRRGFLQRDVQRMVNTDRNVFASSLLKLGIGDAMITGMTRPFAQSMREVRRVLDPAESKLPFGIHDGRQEPDRVPGRYDHQRAAECRGTGRHRQGDRAVARRLGHEPRVAFLSYSTFGNPAGRWLESIRDAVHILDEEQPGFEYDGDMAPDAALNPKIMALYPFCRLTAPANVLIMPGLQSANISAKLLREIGGTTAIGPMLLGMEKPVQIVPMTAIAPDVLTSAVLAAAGITG